MTKEQENKDALTKILERVTNRLQKESEARAASLSWQGYSPRVVAELVEESSKGLVEEPKPPRRIRRRGCTTQRIVELGQMALFERERRGDFTLIPITPGCEYPLILTRAPIFAPTRRSSAKAMLDDELSISFETGWGKGRKYGPPLTIYDEDTLLALGALRQQQLVGLGHKMPICVANLLAEGKRTRVHALYTTVSQIEDYLGNKKGGRGHKKRLESIHRLAAVRIVFSKISDKTMSKLAITETDAVSLIDMKTVEQENDSFLYIQFPPVMALWLAESFAYIDMNIRRQLTDNGKAIHKHLAGQTRFNIFASTLRTVTGSALPMNKFLQELRSTLRKLESLGWLEYELLGNGRSRPYKLVGRRLKKK